MEVTHRATTQLFSTTRMIRGIRTMMMKTRKRKMRKASSLHSLQRKSSTSNTISNNSSREG